MWCPSGYLLYAWKLWVICKYVSPDVLPPLLWLLFLQVQLGFSVTYPCGRMLTEFTSLLKFFVLHFLLCLIHRESLIHRMVELSVKGSHDPNS